MSVIHNRVQELENEILDLKKIRNLISPFIIMDYFHVEKDLPIEVEKYRQINIKIKEKEENIKELKEWKS